MKFQRKSKVAPVKGKIKKMLYDLLINWKGDQIHAPISMGENIQVEFATRLKELG